jgi:large subunit ribosomal protein L25
MSTATQPKIKADVRDRTGTRYAARTREAGQLPAVIYGHKKDPVSIAVDTKAMIALLHDNAHLIEVEVAGKTEPCLVKDIQWDYLGSTILHVDLARVDLTEEVEVEIEIELVGEAVGLKEVGAMIEQNTNTVQIKCRADAIPEKLTHDVSELGVGDSLLVSGLTMPPGVTATSEADTLVAHISIAKAEVEEEEAVEGGDQPEVIGGKPEGEGEDKAKDDAK